MLAQPSPDVVALRGLKPTQLPAYDAKVDVWALGVLVHECLSGSTPFAHSDPESMALAAQFRRPAPLRAGTSTACADFVARALTKSAPARPSAAQLLAHPWITAHVPAEEAGNIIPAACADMPRWCAARSIRVHQRRA